MSLPLPMEFWPSASSCRHFGWPIRMCNLPKLRRNLSPATSVNAFDYMVSSLSPAFATEVRYLIIYPRAADSYDTLKDQLIRRTTLSEQCKLQQLFNSEDLGDHKPTQLLWHMHQLLGRASTIDGTFLRNSFSSASPTTLEWS